MTDTDDVHREPVDGTIVKTPSVRLTPLDGAPPLVVAGPFQVDVRPITAPSRGRNPALVGGDVIVSARVPVGELGAGVERARAAAAKFWTASVDGAFQLEAWHPYPASEDGGKLTIYAVAPLDMNQTVEVDAPAPESDHHAVTVFRGRASTAPGPFGDGEVCDYLMNGQTPPPLPDGR